MKWLIQLLFFAKVIGQSFTQEPLYQPKEVCYLTGSSFQNGFNLDVIQDNTLPCSHVIYSHAQLNDEDSIVEITPSDVSGIQGIMNFKNKSKTNLKVMLQIGGESDGGRFSRMTGDPISRKSMVDSLVKLVQEYGFDGVDLNWRYPGDEQADKKNYRSLAQAIRSEFEMEVQSKSVKDRRLISMVLPNLRDLILPGYDILSLNPVLDFMNLIGYNFISAASPWLDHHAPKSAVSPDFKESSLEFMARLYLRVGITVKKLVLGIPLFGRRYKLDPNNNSTVVDTDTVPYNQICRMLEDKNYQVNNNNSGPFIYKDDEVISYDDEETVSKKAKLVSDFKLGGVMFWSIDMGDWNASCPGNAKKEILPLVQVAKRVIDNGIPVVNFTVTFSNHTEGSSSSTPGVALNYGSSQASNYNPGSNSQSLPQNSIPWTPGTANAPPRPEAGMHPLNTPSQQLFPSFSTILAGKDIIIEDISVEINQNHWPKNYGLP